jgi:hypothetical protein
MNLKYLGDALDHWKGSLFECLQCAEVLRDLAPDPMAADQDKWSDADFSLYARLLHIRQDQVIRHKESLLSRDSYFAEIVHQGDLFLDPDTGVATSRSTRTEHIKPGEIAALLRSTPGRVVAIYQHIRAQKTSDRVENCLNAVAKEISTIRWCSYESPSVAMLFLCGDETRTSEIAAVFGRLLGVHAKRRVRSSATPREM